MKIIQISDLHIKKTPNTLLYGIDPRNGFELTLKSILNSKIDFDSFFLTGDISDDGSIESYEYVLSFLEKFNKNIYFINGNHDSKKNLISVFSKSKYFAPLNELILENWLFIGLDSCLEAKDSGFLSDTEIQRFEKIINKHKEKNFNIGVVVHHHPILVGTPLIDDCPIVNASKWIDYIKKNYQIKLIITGHVHNHYSIEIGEIAKLETGFSSFSLFKKGGSNEN